MAMFDLNTILDPSTNPKPTTKYHISHIRNDTIMVKVTEFGEIRLHNLPNNGVKTIDVRFHSNVDIQDFLEILKQMPITNESFDMICEGVRELADIFNSLYKYVIVYVDETIVVDFKRKVEDSLQISGKSFYTKNEAVLYLISKRKCLTNHMQNKIDEFLIDCPNEFKYQNILDIDL